MSATGAGCRDHVQVACQCPSRPLLLTARLIQQALRLITELSLPFWRSDAPAVTGTDELIDVDQCGEKPDIH